jgi:hypothetical protein
MAKCCKRCKRRMDVVGTHGSYSICHHSEQETSLGEILSPTKVCILSCISFFYFIAFKIIIKNVCLFIFTHMLHVWYLSHGDDDEFLVNVSLVLVYNLVFL